VRFLADESCDGRVVRALRAAGHDVRLAAQDLRGQADERILRAALADHRLLITEDVDFGRLVFLESLPTVGVVLIRWPANDRDGIAHRLAEVASSLGDRLEGAFTVVRPTGVRTRRLDNG
jgi:predicted nuclease of predicted toxin-antitoxin system